MSETRFPNGITGGNGTDLELKSDTDIALYPADHIWISQGTKLIFEGTVPDDFEAKLQATSVTADRDIILPDASGTLALTSDIPVDISELTDTTNLIPTVTSDLTNDSGFITNTNNILTLIPQSVVPPSPTAGMLAVSDGIGWDPATDGVEHLNVYLNGIWVQIA